MNVYVPSKTGMILSLIGACLRVVGLSLELPVLGKIAQIAVAAGMVALIGDMIVGLLDRPSKPRDTDVGFIAFLRAFFSDWLTAMSGPMSVPFVALSLWSTQHWTRVCFACLAGFCAFLGFYRVWRKERLRNKTA
jgi:hypothetical protein